MYTQPQNVQAATIHPWRGVVDPSSDPGPILPSHDDAEPATQPIHAPCDDEGSPSISATRKRAKPNTAAYTAALHLSNQAAPKLQVSEFSATGRAGSSAKTSPLPHRDSVRSAPPLRAPSLTGRGTDLRTSCGHPYPSATSLERGRRHISPHRVLPYTRPNSVQAGHPSPSRVRHSPGLAPLGAAYTNSVQAGRPLPTRVRHSPSLAPLGAALYSTEQRASGTSFAVSRNITPPSDVRRVSGKLRERTDKRRGCGACCCPEDLGRMERRMHKIQGEYAAGSTRGWCEARAGWQSRVEGKGITSTVKVAG
ncbi:hypothetical protein DFH09DRAFT_1084657 [Mycena vulgaris]|nr:hypothetical protein DFH09DRAFT_1084657 [Mycena vulgaris]